MVLLTYIGLSLAAIGSACGIIGSWYVSSHDRTKRRKGFLIWLISNPLNATVMMGVILGFWSGLPLIFNLVTQLYFFYTAFRGWKSNGEHI